MRRLPGAVFVVDTQKEHTAVLEARRLEIPVIALADTNCDPDEMDYPIPANDDAIRAVALLCSKIADAALEGRMQLEAQRKDAAGESSEGEEVLPASGTLSDIELAFTQKAPEADVLRDSDAGRGRSRDQANRSQT